MPKQAPESPAKPDLFCILSAAAREFLGLYSLFLSYQHIWYNKSNMPNFKFKAKKIRPFHIISFLALGSFAVFLTTFSNQPLFNNLDSFVLFAQEEIKIEKEVQVSSGDIGSNKKLDIQKDSIINGNLFADTITLDKGVTINGNVSFNKIKIQKEAQILGSQTKPVSLPIANLPEIPDFQIGTQDFKFEGPNNTLAAGSYRNLVLEKNSRLILTGGVYNLNKLELKENSTLIFSASTTINIQFKLKGQNHTAILPGQNLKPDNLIINYLGILKIKHPKELIKEDDDGEIEQLLDEKERKDCRDGKIGRPVVFGKNSFLNFKLLAPKANVHIGEATTFRGQILARKIKIAKDGILSRKEFFSKDADVNKIVEDQGAKFIVNEVIIRISANATLNDIQEIISLVNGHIIGFLETLQLVKVEIPATTISELNQAINALKALNSPFIQDVMLNFIFN